VTSFCNYIELLLRRSVQLSIRYSALLVLLFFSSCENDPKEIENWTKKAELREEAKTIESYLSQSGIMKAKLIAPLMYRYQRDTVFTEFPNTLNVEFYDDSVRVESWLTAKYGIYSCTAGIKWSQEFSVFHYQKASQTSFGVFHI